MELGIVTLSDSSDDEDNIPSFEERVKRLMNAEKKINTSKGNVQRIHSISDSEESDSNKETVYSSQNSRVSSKLSSELSESNPVVNDFSISSDDELPNLNCIIGTSYESTHGQVCSSESLSQTESVTTNDDDILGISVVPKELNRTTCKTETSKIKETEKLQKLKMKEEKMRVREEKRKERELVKALKASEKEILKNKKPEESLKNMKIVIDHNILFQDGSQSAVYALDQNNLNYSIEENIIKYSVTWYRTVTSISMENQQILKEEREEQTNTLVLIIPNEEFLKLVYAFVQKSKGRNTENLSLSEYILSIKGLYPDMEITCVTAGFNTYMRAVKEESNPHLKVLAKEVHKNAVEEAMLELQLQTFINFTFLANMVEVGSLMFRFTKAISGAPQRKEKQLLKSLTFSWYADADSSCPVKLAKDDSCFVKLWQQQLQQFQNVSADVAQAIVSQYPSLQTLLKAYRRCATLKEAESLLQDIVVRRNYGPLGTQKRIGPELSYKIHLYFTSHNGKQLLKR